MYKYCMHKILLIILFLSAPGTLKSTLTPDSVEYYITLRTQPNTMNVTEPAWVLVTLDSLFPKQNIRLNWRIGEDDFKQISFDFSLNLTDTVYIPAPNTTAKIDYYLEAIDEYGQSLFYPPNAPDSLFSYLFTEYSDFPEETAWISFSKLDQSALRPALSIYDLELGVSLHTYPETGGYLNISPNNKYLVSDNKSNDELAIINVDTGQIIKKILYYNDLLPQNLAITNDGMTIFMSATSDIPGSLTRTFRISVEQNMLIELDDSYSGIEYSPMNNRLFLIKNSLDQPIDIYDLDTGVVVDSLVPDEMPYFISHIFSLSDNYRVLSELTWGGGKISGRYNTGIICIKRNLITGEIFKTSTINLPELENDLRDNSLRAALIPNSSKVVVAIRQTDNIELNFWDFEDANWHRAVILTEFVAETSYTEMSTSSSGKKLLISRVGSPAGPFMAVVDLDTYQLKRYLFQPVGQLFDARFEMKNPPFNEIVKRGDANLNDKIDIFDVLTILGIISGKNRQVFFESDVNDDGKIDIFDLLALLKMLKGQSGS